MNITCFFCPSFADGFLSQAVKGRKHKNLLTKKHFSYSITGRREQTAPFFRQVIEKIHSCGKILYASSPQVSKKKNGKDLFCSFYNMPAPCPADLFVREGLFCADCQENRYHQVLLIYPYGRRKKRESPKKDQLAKRLPPRRRSHYLSPDRLLFQGLFPIRALWNETRLLQRLCPGTA